MTDNAATVADNSESASPKRRGPLIAGIGLVLAIVIGVVVFLTQRGGEPDTRAQDAAATYQADREEWLAAVDALDFAQYEDFEATVFSELTSAVHEMHEATEINWREPSTAGDPARVEATCAAIAEHGEGLSQFESANPPTLEEIPGGEDNADYLAAQEQQTDDEARHQAIQDFVGQAREGFADIAEACSYFLAENDAAQALAEAQNELLTAYTLDDGTRVHMGSEQVSGATHDYYAICDAEWGCVPFDDMDARAAAGDLSDAAFDKRHLGMAEVMEAHCPAALQEVCDERREVELTLHELAMAIGEAYRTEDPVAVTMATSNEETMPELDAANEAYNAAWSEQYGAFDARVEELTGHASIYDAIDALALAAAGRIQTAAENVVIH